MWSVCLCACACPVCVPAPPGVFLPVKRHRGEPGHTRDTGVKRHRGEPGHTRDTGIYTTKRLFGCVYSRYPSKIPNTGKYQTLYGQAASGELGCRGCWVLSLSLIADGVRSVNFRNFVRTLSLISKINIVSASGIGGSCLKPGGGDLSRSR